VAARAAVLVGLALLFVAAPALAWRTPSTAQRKAITTAIRRHPAAAERLTFTLVRVSTADRSYAGVRTFGRDRNGDPVGNAEWLLRRRTSGWRVVFAGSDLPWCDVAPAAVRRDLLGSTACLHR
jgi:hypothetical protein